MNFKFKFCCALLILLTIKIQLFGRTGPTGSRLMMNELQPASQDEEKLKAVALFDNLESAMPQTQYEESQIGNPVKSKTEFFASQAEQKELQIINR